ncbi:tyrosine-protein phosphatase non-receptor type 1-like isoform X2 [Anneissia japonica]|uniref:tyrosine-protein phosphatase non-receptor type 1-like isoform X2 n=1 Tax=Anneissia japonica TaxID=1529436 RepID=UPI00142573DC|nr:tyrosine-protein phosphatase non-receptor type 1-like isoform X2 [Anneissia japonica]
MEETFSRIDEGSSGWGNAFMNIQTNCFEFNYTTLEARKADNKKRNRYRDVLPYDHSRVKLEVGNSDYINACFVHGKKAGRKYILTQGPKDNTAGHFWQMVWEQNCKVIVMLNKVIEKGVLKCAQYFPLGGDDNNRSMVFDTNYRVEYISEEVSSFYTIRTMKLEHIPTGTSKQVLHFHYTKWPDFGVPQSPAAFLSFLAAVREKGGMDGTGGPPVVHCSAGVGRSGSFCLVDTCLAMIEKDGDDKRVNVMEILLDMRRDRMGLIQTPAQLRFSYLALLEGAHAVLQHTPLGSLAAEDEVPSGPPPLPPRQNKRPHSPDNPDMAGENFLNVDQRETEPYFLTRLYKHSFLLMSRLVKLVMYGASVLRKRLRDEKNQAMKEKVERMKEKQRKSEAGKKKRSLLKKSRGPLGKK